MIDRAKKSVAFAALDESAKLRDKEGERAVPLALPGEKAGGGSISTQAPAMTGACRPLFEAQKSKRERSPLMQLGQQAVCILAPVWACQNPSDGEPGRKSGTKSGIFAEPAPLRIVVVEDEPFVRLDIEAVLTAAGHDVIAAADTAEDAIAIAEQERPDLMIMDVRLLEGGDGVKAAIEIWERFGIRSLFASANLDPIMRARAGRANPVGFVDKPFLTATLLAALPKKA